jgi:hypothetical protein
MGWTVNPTTTYEHERYVREVVARVGASTLGDMKAVMDAIARDAICGDAEWSLRSLAEGILKGELDPIPDLPRKVVAEYVRRNTRPTLHTHLLRRQSGDPRASRFFGVPCLPPGTPWPVTEEGEPMRFVLQVDFDVAGLRPEAIPDVGFMAVFVTPSEWDEEEGCPGMIDAEDPVVVVTAGSAAECEPAAVPDGYVMEKAKEIGFRRRRSFPAGDDPFVEMPPGVTLETLDRTNLGHRLDIERGKAASSYETLIGGWPKVIQTNYPCWDLDTAAPVRPHPFVMEIGTEAGLIYGYGCDGLLYLMHGRLLDGTVGWSSHLDID